MKPKLNKKKELYSNKNSNTNKLRKILKNIFFLIFKDDSLKGNIAFIIFSIIFLKFIFFPTIGFFLGNDFPIVAIVSGSMEHKAVDSGYVCGKTINRNGFLDFDLWWNTCGDYYEKNFNLTKEKFRNFPYINGLNIGDVMVLKKKNIKDIKIGEILVFQPDASCPGSPPGPVIHRVVDKRFENGKYFFTTKGDHNPRVWECLEGKIDENRVIANPILRIKYIGLVKYYLTKIFNIF